MENETRNRGSMSDITIIDTTAIHDRKVIIISARINTGAWEIVHGRCTPSCDEDELREACGKTETTMSGKPSVARNLAPGERMEHFTVRAYTGD